MKKLTAIWHLIFAKTWFVYSNNPYRKLWYGEFTAKEIFEIKAKLDERVQEELAVIETQKIVNEPIK